MSCWIVTKAHIDLLVQAAIVEGETTFAEADDFGRRLWEANWLGFDFNYDGRYPEDRPPFEEYSFVGIEAPLDDQILHRQLRCYEYQSCDRDEWDDSPEDRFVQAMAAKIEARNPGVDLTVLSYPDVPWGIDSIEQAINRNVA